MIEPTIENAPRVRHALERWGGFEPEFGEEEFIAGDILSFGGLLRVEVHLRVRSVNWEQVWAHRVEAAFGDVPTQFASLDDLIAMKEATGRKEKDRPDLTRLRALQVRLRR